MRARDLTSAANEAAALAWREPGLVARRGSVALFRAGWLDLFTRSHPALPALALGPVVLWQASLAMGSGASVVGLAGALLLGALSWTLIEYAMHRFLFHAEARSEAGRIALLLAHGHHHVWPDDRSRITATPIQFGSITLLFWGLYRGALAWVAGEGVGSAALAGALAAYLAYEALHWMAHHGRPRSRVLAAIKAHHMAHHHKDPRSRWGISSPLWDLVLCTR